MEYQAVIKNRFTGKTNSMILLMIPELLKGSKVAIVGCKCPKDIVERLKKHGLHVESQPMTVTDRLRPVHNLNSIEGEILGFENTKKTVTGFIFYCKAK